MELSQAQAKLDECMEQLALKSKDLANTKSEAVSLQQQQTQVEQQVWYFLQLTDNFYFELYWTKSGQALIKNFFNSINGICSGHIFIHPWCAANKRDYSNVRNLNFLQFRMNRKSINLANFSIFYHL